MSRFSAPQILVIAVLATSGCTQTSQVTYWQPAELSSHNLRHVAVAPLDGEGSGNVRRAIELQIAEVENLTAVDRALLEREIRQVGHTPDEQHGEERLLRLARRNNVDALVVGKVTAYTSNPFLKKVAGDANDAVRTARVSVALRLIDVETGEILEEREVSRSFDRKRKGDRLLPSGHADVMERLTDECVGEFMQLLAPYEAQATIELATGEFFSLGGLDVQRGAKRAVDGDWEAAERIWRSVVEREPENDAALFNLAVAAANRQDYCAAEDYAMQAIRIRHTDCYAAGQEQIRRFRSHEDRIARNCDVPLTAHLP